MSGNDWIFEVGNGSALTDYFLGEDFVYNDHLASPSFRPINDDTSTELLTIGFVNWINGIQGGTVIYDSTASSLTFKKSVTIPLDYPWITVDLSASVTSLTVDGGGYTITFILPPLSLTYVPTIAGLFYTGSSLVTIKNLNVTGTNDGSQTISYPSTSTINSVGSLIEDSIVIINYVNSGIYKQITNRYTTLISGSISYTRIIAFKLVTDTPLPSDQTSIIENNNDEHYSVATFDGIVYSNDACSSNNITVSGCSVKKLEATLENGCIFGQYAGSGTGGSAVAIACYTTGNSSGATAGMIFGANAGIESGSARAIACYTTGNSYVDLDRSGMIFGINGGSVSATACYSSGEGIYISDNSIGAFTDCYYYYANTNKWIKYVNDNVGITVDTPPLSNDIFNTYNQSLSLNKRIRLKIFDALPWNPGSLDLQKPSLLNWASLASVNTLTIDKYISVFSNITTSPYTLKDLNLNNLIPDSTDINDIHLILKLGTPKTLKKTAPTAFIPKKNKDGSVPPLIVSEFILNKDINVLNNPFNKYFVNIAGYSTAIKNWGVK